MDKVRVAIVGAGSMVNSAHAPSLAAMPDVELVGICDIAVERAQETARKYGIARSFADYREMLSTTDPDAVYVVVRPQHLFDIADFVLRAGKHLFVEKPPGVYTEQTRQLANIAAAHECLTAVGFQRRYTPITVECRRRVLERGPMYQVLVSFLKWYDDGPMYGGATDLLYADVIHIVDTIRWAAGAEAVEVYSDVKAHDGMGYANSHNAFLRFANGTIGFLQSNHRVGARQLRFEFHGRGISCVFEPEKGGVIYKAKQAPVELDAVQMVGGPEMYRIGFYQECRHFLDCVKTGRQPQTALPDALQTMKLCDTILRRSQDWAGGS
jgi:virulence factor